MRALKSVYLHSILIIWIFSLQQSLCADTYEKKTITPGVIYHRVYMQKGPWSINVLEVDLKEPTILLRTYKAGHNLIGRKKISEMAIDMRGDDYEIIAGINGDFFSREGIQVGVQVMDGMILSKPCGRSVFGLTDKKRPFIDIVDYDARVYTAEGKWYTIHTINDRREKDFLVLYNTFSSPTTLTNKWGTEVAIEILGKSVINDTIKGIVRQKETLRGNMQIPSNGFILSGHDLGHNFLKNNILSGDTVKIYLGLPPIDEQVSQVIGGVPRLIRQGRISVEYERESISEAFVTTRHPRTAIGFSKDSTKVFMMTVDGRQPGFSEGMSLYELAEFLLDFGANDALNLDGGGSTTMIIDDKIVNSPSDSAGERPVSNGLFIIKSKAPGDKVWY